MATTIAITIVPYPIATIGTIAFVATRPTIQPIATPTTTMLTTIDILPSIVLLIPTML